MSEEAVWFLFGYIFIGPPLGALLSATLQAAAKAHHGYMADERRREYDKSIPAKKFEAEHLRRLNRERSSR